MSIHSPFCSERMLLCFIHSPCSKITNHSIRRCKSSPKLLDFVKRLALISLQTPRMLFSFHSRLDTDSQPVKAGKKNESSIVFSFSKDFAKSGVPGTTQSCTACDAVAAERKGQPSSQPRVYVLTTESFT